MMHRRIAVPAFLVALTFPGIGSAPARSLGFAERVEAQRAIERVYYSHQVGAVRPFEEAVPQELLERKVRTYLKQSAALEKYWNTPVTGEALRRELERIAAATRSPDRLREIYQALGNDPVLIQECFVRPVLVDRLARNFLAYDERVQEPAKEKLLRLPDLPERGTATTPGGIEASVVEIVKRDAARIPRAEADEASPFLRDGRIELDADEFSRWRSRAPDAVGETSPIQEERDAFVVRRLLREDASSARIATWSSPKIFWDVWWQRESSRFDESSVQPVAARNTGIPSPATESGTSSESACLVADSWGNASLDDAPRGLTGHTVVWTGTEMIVWGGTSGALDTGVILSRNEGYRYDPLTDHWTPTSLVGAPEPRSRHTAIWTGTEMIVWGGRTGTDASTKLNSGARYTPVTDTWIPTNPSAISSRYDHVAVWTGSRMVVWGGSNGIYLADGGQYNPELDVWTDTSQVAAPPGASGATAVWTGSRMVVWGGATAASPSGTSTGGVYDPATDTWIRNTSLTGAPTPRTGHTAVWTGSRMVVWGGSNLNTGGRYDPATDTWQSTSTVNAPQERQLHAAVWTGSVMVVWGGMAFAVPVETFLNTGGRYDPVSDSWLPITTTNAPSPRRESTAVWTGSRMILWGGDTFQFAAIETGGRYDPSTDSWSPTFAGSPPGARHLHSAVWTGNEMIVWGGLGGVAAPALTSGARYDPLTDSWTATSTSGAPAGRMFHTTVWTGSRMIVYGGTGANFTPVLNTGGEYDPAADSWVATPNDLFRYQGVAVWTGSRMLVWGGTDDNSVSIYDPAARTWTKSTTANAPGPAPVYKASAVWTGSEMIVWGGAIQGSLSNQGRRYDPAADSWTAVSTLDAPVGREQHTAVWTGTEMIIWGGGTGAVNPPGGRYVPQTDTWSVTSLAGAPEHRRLHAAVWTGKEMLMWGGFHGGTAMRSGGRYDPAQDLWNPISLVGAPPGAQEFAAVWTGTEMIVWGGYDSFVLLSTGGRYAPEGTDLDRDGDAFSSCAGDCNDTDPTIHPGAVEVCNGIDEDCDASIDEGADALCADSNACTTDLCTGASGCQHPAVPDGTACDDGRACTTGDVCQAGSCLGGGPATPPGITVSLSPSVLSSNHNMVTVTATVTARDACGAPVGVVLTSITSSEPDDAPGPSDGSTVNDIQGAQIGTADFSFQLRAERDRNGPGRTYTVTYTATDSAGNTADGVATVFVPVKRGGHVPKPTGGSRPVPRD